MIASSHKPYDYFEALERLRTSAHDMSTDERNRLKMVVALNTSDPQAASTYADLLGEDWRSLYPPVANNDSIGTIEVIDRFIDTYGKSSPEEDALLERLIFNPVPEYGQVLARKESETDQPDDLAQLAKEINSKKPEQRPESASTKSTFSNQNSESGIQKSSFSLELAKIFVKQGHFNRAHDIISKIILNNPEKNAYFADQLRFLEKLMLIKEAKKLKN